MLVANRFIYRELVDARVYNEASTLVKHGMRTTVLCSGPESADSTFQGIQIQRIPSKSGVSYEGIYFPMLSTLKLLRLDRKQRFDVIHGHNPPDHIILPAHVLRLLRAARRRKVGVILDMHDPVVTAMASYGIIGPYSKALVQMVERTCTRIADVIIVVSEASRRRLVGLGVPKEKVFVVRNFVDTDLFDPNSADPSLVKKSLGLEGKRIILYSGAMKNGRGVTVLLDAFSQLSKDLGDTVLFLPGLIFGKYRQVLDAKVQHIEPAGRVLFPGQLPYWLMPSIIAAADVCVIPTERVFHSAVIGNPNKLFQYLAMGKPVVASDVPTISEFVDERTAVLVPPGDVSALKTAIVKLLDDRKLAERIGRKARSLAIEKYTWKQQEPILMKAYQMASGTS